MAEQEPGTETGERRPARPKVNVVALVLGFAVLVSSAYVLSDGPSWLPAFDLRWVLAGGAVLAGVLLLGASRGNGRGCR